MKVKRFVGLGVLVLLLSGCTTVRTLDLEYLPGKPGPGPARPVTIAVIPFEDTTWNGQEDQVLDRFGHLLQRKVDDTLFHFPIGHPGGKKRVRSFRLYLEC